MLLKFLFWFYESEQISDTLFTNIFLCLVVVNVNKYLEI